MRSMLSADDVLNQKFAATKFREGYDQASQSMFDMAIRTGRRTPVTEAARSTPSVGPVNGRRPSRFETANLDSVAATVG